MRALSILGFAILIGLFWIVPSSTFSSPSLDFAEAEFLDLINEYRAESDQCWNGAVWRAWAGHELRGLAESYSLSVASENHNLTMIDTACVEHQCPGEAPLPERVTDAGYDNWSKLRENIGAGEGLEEAQDIVRGWRNSEPHNRAMLSCHMVSIGIARNYSSNSEYGWYWTTDFGDVLD